jgi:S1-C subfamily serine protease
MGEDLNPSPTSDTRGWSDRIQRLRFLGGRALAFAIIIISAFLGVLLFNYFFPAPIPLSQNEIDESISQAMASATPAPAYSAQVYQTILPSLVFIQTQRESAADDEKFGVGSGVVVNENGEILTALHVVADASEIEVLFADGTQATAEIVYAEPKNDIAVLHPSQPPEIIVPAVLGNPGALRVGDEAYAVGNPLGLAGSMSAGVISGFDRSFEDENGDRQLQGLIQFDTAVNPGNSGGPLLNRRGQVIGIVTALANPTEQNFFVGIGFAVPIGTAVSVAGGGPEY